jgi:protein-L-isoaspartate(D-aspartate) O-methyltransferase
MSQDIAMSFEQARTNMIKQQMRTWDVLDNRVLEQFERIPRDVFVPEAFVKSAYADMNIPLSHEQEMLTPKEEARMIQALALKPTDVVLEIGTGTGFTAAVMASLAQHVISVDIFSEFTDKARHRLNTLDFKNITLVNADAAQGWSEQGPYDVIVVTGGLALFPERIKQDLKPSGRLFAIVGQDPVMTAMLITRTSRHVWETQPLFETMTPLLVNAPTTEKFVF